MALAGRRGSGARPDAPADGGSVGLGAAGSRAQRDQTIRCDAEPPPHRFGLYNNCPAHGFPLVRFSRPAVIIDGAQQLNGQLGYFYARQSTQALSLGWQKTWRGCGMAGIECGESAGEIAQELRDGATVAGCLETRAFGSKV